MKFTVSDKDKKMIMILLIIAIVFCSWYFGYRNINQMTIDMKAERDALTKRYQSLYPLYAERENYKKQGESFNAEYTSLLEKFPTGSTQEGMIVLAKAIEEDTDVWFNTFNMSGVDPIYTFGLIGSTNPSNLGGTVYSTDYVGHKVTLTMNYETTYAKGKKLIEYLNTNVDRKYTIDSVNMTYNEKEDTLSGTLVLSTFDITGSDRTFPLTSVSNVPVGTKNLFMSSTFSATGDYNGEEGDRIITDYDIFMMAGAYNSDVDSVIVGLANDVLGKTTASANGNSETAVTLTVTGSDGDYKVSYKVGATTYPVENYFEGADLAVGKTLDMLIMSTARLSEQDKASVKLNIVNRTDKTINIKIINDDEDTPRVNMGTTTGTVKLYRSK